MSLFQYECDSETPTLQLRSANGYYLAQVRLWSSMQETVNSELSLPRHTFSFPGMCGEIRLDELKRPSSIDICFYPISPFL
jgi:hypothetical protein